MGRDVTLTCADKDGFDCYLAGKANAGAAVMILHEWWGLKPHNRRWADRLAEAGYLAMAVDLYDGRVTDDSEVAATWMREIDQQAADRKLVAAIDYLTGSDRPLAVYGCSFGGKQAMQASLLRPEKINATVLAYCRMETDPEKLSRLQGPVLAIYAQQERNWPQKQEDFESAMQAAGGATRSVGYDAAHGFTNPESPRYDLQADAAAWSELTAFLQEQLA
ncbi:MAG: dienelactone hydrolase family protein [Candidatus Thiodiazotropha sp. (ex Monitilora ramsayi)]|nr:dienelactone hydrolase family protein [Candidatus Thiodiazotropha sp. (ex Monitilora ramsayi)]